MINGWSTSEYRIKDGKKVDKNFSYTSENNDNWMKISELRDWMKNYL